MVETTGVEPVVPFGRRIYSPLGLPIFLHLHLVTAQFTILLLPGVNTLRMLVTSIPGLRFEQGWPCTLARELCYY